MNTPRSSAFPPGPIPGKRSERSLIRASGIGAFAGMRADEGRSHARIRAAGGCINDGNAVAAVQGPCHGRASLWPDRAGELTATLRSAPAVVPGCWSGKRLIKDATAPQRRTAWPGLVAAKALRVPKLAGRGAAAPHGPARLRRVRRARTGRSPGRQCQRKRPRQYPELA